MSVSRQLYQLQELDLEIESNERALEQGMGLGHIEGQEQKLKLRR